MADKKEYTIEEKLIILQRIHNRSAPDTKLQIGQWQDELMRLKFADAWLKDPNTVKLKETLITQLDRLVSVLSNDQKLGDVERLTYFKAKDLILILLATLTIDPEEQIKSLETTIDGELN